MKFVQRVFKSESTSPVQQSPKKNLDASPPKKKTRFHSSTPREMFAGTRQQLPATSRQPTSGSATEVTRYSVSNGAIGGSTKFPFRLNFYDRPPLEEITLEDFELWAIDRLKGASVWWNGSECRLMPFFRGAVLADIESGLARNRTYEEIKTLVLARCKSFLPLGGNSNKSTETDAERKKDQYGHFVLRLAFCRSSVLRCADFVWC